MILKCEGILPVQLCLILGAALAAVNSAYNGNLQFKRCETRGKAVRFTIRAVRSGLRGASITYNGRASVAASWHAHGDLFDEILKRCPEAVIVTRSYVITRHSGNWVDYPVTRYMVPPITAAQCSVLYDGQKEIKLREELEDV